MNFETIYNTRGQKVPMFGTLKELKGGGMTPNNKPYAKVSITDDTGKTSNVKIYGDVLPQAQQIGQRLQWTISTYDYVYNGKSGVAFSGFWNSNAQVAGTPATPTYNQAPQTPPAPQNSFEQAVKQTYHQDSSYWSDEERAKRDAKRDDDIKFGQAANLAIQQCQIDKSILMFEEYQQKYYKFLINRKMPAKMPIPKQEPEFDDEPAQEQEHNYTDSDIPF